MSEEKYAGHEVAPGEFEFSLVFGALKAKFAEAKREQAHMAGYRMFTLTRVDAAKDALARFRMVDVRFADDLQAAAQDPNGVIDVALPIAFPDSVDPVLVSDTILHEEEPDYFVLYKQNGPLVVDAEHMQERVIDADPDFVMRVQQPHSVVPISKPSENEI